MDDLKVLDELLEIIWGTKVTTKRSKLKRDKKGRFAKRSKK
tara:strand:- start:10939 stop:11061 length:123 start_codon:yes stop_codon:yes gene_type:complete